MGVNLSRSIVGELLMNGVKIGYIDRDSCHLPPTNHLGVAVIMSAKYPEALTEYAKQIAERFDSLFEEVYKRDNLLRKEVNWPPDDKGGMIKIVKDSPIWHWLAIWAKREGFFGGHSSSAPWTIRLSAMKYKENQLHTLKKFEELVQVFYPSYTNKC